MVSLLSSRPTATRSKGLRAAGALAALVIGAAIAPVAAASTAEAVTPTTTPALCGTATTATLWAGQNTNAGTVTVGNDKDYLYVIIDNSSPWAMAQSHVAVADTLAGIPQTNKGMPKIGNFGHQRSYSPAQEDDVYRIPKAAVSLDQNQGFVVAVHAALVKLGADGAVVGSETGWAAGTPFVERGSWATFMSGLWQDCAPDAPVETATETAFAKDTTGGTANCFLDLDLDADGRADFNRWGWTNGKLGEGDYSFELYAGAGRCDTAKGTDVGKVTLSYHDGTATVTITTEGTNPITGVKYSMADAQVHVGAEMLARNNGEYTVAPGQFSQVISEANGATTKTFTFSDLTGDVYLVAHTSVAGFPLPAK